MLDPLLDDEIAFADLLHYGSQLNLPQSGKQLVRGDYSNNSCALAIRDRSEQPVVVEADRANLATRSAYFELEELRRSATVAPPIIRVPRTADSYAAPLSPLKERDSQALAGWFETDSMPEIEADVTRYLLLLWPEPCWDEDLYGFLHDYL
jgi:hypothetical protein